MVVRGVAGFRNLGLSIYVLDLLLVVRRLDGFRFLGFNVNVSHCKLAVPGVYFFAYKKDPRLIVAPDPAKP